MSLPTASLNARRVTPVLATIRFVDHPDGLGVGVIPSNMLLLPIHQPILIPFQ